MRGKYLCRVYMSCGLQLGCIRDVIDFIGCLVLTSSVSVHIFFHELVEIGFYSMVGVDYRGGHYQLSS